MTTVRVLLLDADGVIQSAVPGWLSSVASLCGDDKRTDAFLEDVFAAERPCLTGSGGFRVALAEVLERWGSAATVAEALALWTQIEPREDLLQLVRSLRETGIRVGLATNQQSFRATYMTDELGYGNRFDDLYFSCHLGHAKPSQNYFRAVLESLDCPAGDVLFVDDHARNVAAARESGFNAEIYDMSTGVEGMRTLLARYGIAGGLA